MTGVENFDGADRQSARRTTATMTAPGAHFQIRFEAPAK
jgi:hypothetical protein